MTTSTQSLVDPEDLMAQRIHTRERGEQMNSLENLRPMNRREQLDFLLVLAVDEWHEEMTINKDEPADTWIKFIGECSIKLLEES